MSSDIALELREIVDELTVSIAEFRESVVNSTTYPYGQRAESARDVNGRPILGDLLAAKANALAALSRLENHA